jgi:site-specific recombinase XerD
MINVTPGEFRKMLAQVDIHSPLGPRDYLLLVLDFNTGLRVSELAGLTVEMVSHQGEPRASLYVSQQLAKGHRARLIPLNALAQKAIRKLLAFNRARGFSVLPEAPLFVTRNHTPLPVRSIQFMVTRLREKAGLDFKASPHSIRHSFACQVAETSGNLRIVQQLLGHKQLNTVAIYTHPRRDELARAVDMIVQPKQS